MVAGDVIVLLDVDMLVPTGFVENLVSRHFSDGQQQCIVGQMVDYDNNATDVGDVRPQPFAHYAARLASLQKAGPGRIDARLHAKHVIGWAFAWTALVALPRSMILAHDLFFDLSFQGWGVEDLEWAYRIEAAGLPITVAEDVFGIHMPHQRDVAANKETERANYAYFLRKWPTADVELAVAYGDFEANACAPAVRSAVAASFGGSPGVVRGAVQGLDIAVVGATLDGDGEPDAATTRLFAGGRIVATLPLVGFALPWRDGAVDRCIVRPTVNGLPASHREIVLAECTRISKTPPERLT